MAKYLDPKADLTFKKIFGEHPHLVMSLLNALLPLPKGQEIQDIEYMSPERVPCTSIGKNSIVDVFCKAKDGRHLRERRARVHTLLQDGSREAYEKSHRRLTPRFRRVTEV